MGSQKISAMPDAGALAGTELVPVVKGGINDRTTTLAIGSLLFVDMAFRAIGWWDGAKLTFDPNFSYTPGSGLRCVNVTAETFTSAISGDIIIRDDDTIHAAELHAANGFTGTGSYSILTIVDGIIVAAS